MGMTLNCFHFSLKATRKHFLLSVQIWRELLIPHLAVAPVLSSQHLPNTNASDHKDVLFFKTTHSYVQPVKPCEQSRAGNNSLVLTLSNLTIACWYAVREMRWKMYPLVAQFWLLVSATVTYPHF